MSKTVRPPRAAKSALLVFTGIFLSKIAGVIRTSFITRYFGLGDEADAFWIATRIPNVLQNLLGDGQRLWAR